MATPVWWFKTHFKESFVIILVLIFKNNVIDRQRNASIGVANLHQIIHYKPTNSSMPTIIFYVLVFFKTSFNIFLFYYFFLMNRTTNSEFVVYFGNVVFAIIEFFIFNFKDYLKTRFIFSYDISHLLKKW